MNKKILVVASVFYACNSYTSKNENGTTIVPDGAPLDYSVMHEKVFQPYCIQCHSRSGGDQGNVNLENYANIKRYIAEVEDFAVVKKTMPPDRPLPESIQETLNTWVAQGSPEFAEKPKPTPFPVPTPTPAPTPKPSPTPTPGGSVMQPTYSSINALLLKSKCVICHGPGGSESKRPLDTYTNLINKKYVVPGKATSSPIYSEMKSGSMPPRPAAHISAADLQIVNTWITNGAQNN